MHLNVSFPKNKVSLSLLEGCITKIGLPISEEQINLSAMNEEGVMGEEGMTLTPLVFYNGLLLQEQDYDIKQKDVGGCYRFSWVLTLKCKAPSHTFSVSIISYEQGLRYDYFVKNAKWKFE
jgi:hypothetical protein